MHFIKGPILNATPLIRLSIHQEVVGLRI